jgi:hypothetical protein
MGQNRSSFYCAFRDETTKAFAQDDTSFEKVEHFNDWKRTGNMQQQIPGNAKARRWFCRS